MLPSELYVGEKYIFPQLMLDLDEFVEIISAANALPDIAALKLSLIHI